MLTDYGLIVVRFTSTMGMSNLKIINTSQLVGWSVGQSELKAKKPKLRVQNSEEKPSVTKGIEVLRASE